jgi:hypothetical protein
VLPRIKWKNRILWVSGSFHADRHTVPSAVYDHKKSAPRHERHPLDFAEMIGQREAAGDIARRQLPYLADNECEHGSLPTDHKISCACFPRDCRAIPRDLLESRVSLENCKTAVTNTKLGRAGEEQ